MPKALFFIGWDDAIGPELKYSHPKDFEMDIDYILQYLMTIQAVSSSNTIQIKDENQNVLIYGIPTGDSTKYNYNFLILLLNEDEDGENFQYILQSRGNDVIEETGDRESNFRKLAHVLFNPPVQKIVFMGLPNAGKTSTKLFFFQKAREEGLLNTTITPTQGFESSSYKFMDLNISMFDTSGQELERWFTESRDIVFSSDLVVFFFSVDDWLNQKEYVKEELTKFVKLKDHDNADIKNMIIFCHKIDTIEENADLFKDGVQSFTKTIGLPVFFTSIADGGNQDLMVGIQMLLTQFSSFFANLQGLIEPITVNYDFLPLVLLNNNFRPVIHYKSVLNEKIPLIGLKKLFTRFMIDKDEKIAGKIKFSIHWQQDADNEYGILFVNVSSLSPQVSYLVLKTDSLIQCNKFKDDFTELMKPLNWSQKVVSKSN